MTDLVAIGAITGGINLSVNLQELKQLGLNPGSFNLVSQERMKEIHESLENSRTHIPEARSGGSVANTTDFLARTGVKCAFMGIGGDDKFGQAVVSKCKENSIAVLNDLQKGALTGYDFYLEDEFGKRTILLTHGANALLHPQHIDTNAISKSRMLLLDGGALNFGPDSSNALELSIETAKEAKVPFILTLASVNAIEQNRSFFDRYSSEAQFVAGNREQAATLLGLGRESSIELIQGELQKSQVNALVTLDASGVYAQIDGREFLVPTKSKTTVDSTGAGDNFLGAYLAARFQDYSIQQSLQMANFVAAEVLQFQSARFPPDYDVKALLDKATRSVTNLTY